MTNVDIAVFAHNEELRIAAMMSDLARQTIFADPLHSVRLMVLANGCKDATCDVAMAAVREFPEPQSIEICNLPEGGKSRTWNSFVHRLSRRDAGILVFLDADISLPQSNAIADLIEFLDCRSELQASSSLPIKDIEHFPVKLGLIERLIAAGGRTSGHNLRTAICGQFYAIRSIAAREIKLPIGLPVEDGFVRHAIITGLFRQPVDEARIDQPAGLFHVYPSERSVSSLLRHQVRIVIGSAINAALFAHFVRLNSSGAKDQIVTQLERSACSAAWLPQTMKKLLPDPGYGWVPLPWLYGRTWSFIQNGPYSSRRLLIAVLGLGMDFVVYVAAQIRMARGAGAGYW